MQEYEPFQLANQFFGFRKQSFAMALEQEPNLQQLSYQDPITITDKGGTKGGAYPAEADNSKSLKPEPLVGRSARLQAFAISRRNRGLS